MITLRPTGTYEVTLPDDVVQQQDERVSSFWRPPSHTALQLSSYAREAYIQIDAAQRLGERLESVSAVRVRLSTLDNVWCPDVATARATKADGWVWTHAYLVWPDLAVYATVSRPPYEDTNSEAWAIEAVRSIRRAFVT